MIIPKALLASIVLVLAAVMAYLTAGAHVAITPDNQAFGAVSVLQSPLEVSAGGGTARIYMLETAMRQSSSTLATFVTPNATTTLSRVQCNVASGNTYANTYQIGWSANTQGAITTMIAQNVIAANKSGVIVATSTGLVQAIGGGVEGVVGPNTIINAILSTTTSVTLAPVGSCLVELKSF